MVIIDHKSKTLTSMKFESIPEFFAEKGMRCFSSMNQWYGSCEVNDILEEGYFVWFIDFIMENIGRQSVRDVVPCLEALIKELQSNKFCQIFSNTANTGGSNRPTEFILGADHTMHVSFL